MLFLFGGSASAAANQVTGNGSTFLPASQAFQLSVSQTGQTLSLHWMVAKGYYLYRKRISIVTRGGGFTAGPLKFSAEGVVKNDPYFGEVTIFPKSFSATTTLRSGGTGGAGKVVITYQGCAKAGMCYAPQKRSIALDELPEAPVPAGKAPHSQADKSGSVGGLAQLLRSEPLWQLSLVFLLLGVGLAFTPCVLPMLPVVSSMVGAHKTGNAWAALGLASAYVLGMAVTYSVAGIVTGLFGASFDIQAALQSPWALGGAAALFLLLALACFDVYHLQLPGVLRERLPLNSQRLGGGGIVSVFAIGSVSALVMSPCITPPLAAALLYIGATQDAIKGGVVLFFLALGMGLPLMLVAVAGRSVLPRSGPWLSVVKGFYGVLLLGVALWLLSRVLPSAVTLLLLGLVAAIGAVGLGAFDGATTRWRRVRKGVGLIMFIYGATLVVGAVGGGTSPVHPLEGVFAGTTEPRGLAQPLFERYTRPALADAALREAAQKGQPAVLEFYAKWCVSCQEMERTVFEKPSVRAALQQFRRIQLDVTDNTPQQQHMLERYGIYGPPSMMFFDREGNERRNDRVIGAVGLRALLNHVHRSLPAARIAAK